MTDNLESIAHGADLIIADCDILMARIVSVYGSLQSDTEAALSGDSGMMRRAYDENNLRLTAGM
jgi:hypothetical protein